MRKRRTKYEWFLNTGTTGPAADGEDDTSAREWTISLPANGTTGITVLDLLEDTPSDDQATGLPLGFYQNNEYIIRRIVGKSFTAFSQTNADTVAQACLVGAGIFIARAEDDDSGGPNLPIGGGSTAQLVDNYSPLRVENIREPWIWRRTWILGNVLGTGVSALDSAVRTFPRNCADYGSIQDGAHIDAKTMRRVKDGERLWWVAAARNAPLNTTFQTATNIYGLVDYRILGRRTRKQGKSAF